MYFPTALYTPVPALRVSQIPRCFMLRVVVNLGYHLRKNMELDGSDAAESSKTNTDGAATYGQRDVFLFINSQRVLAQTIIT
jgi:hypothetical protein